MSPEGTLDSKALPPLSANQRQHASRRFYQIINHFDVADEAARRHGTSYNRPRLIRLTHEYALSEESRDLLLRAFFQSLQLGLADEADVTFGENEERTRSDVIGFAEYLMENLFLHLRVPRDWTARQLSPDYDSAVLMVQGCDQEYATTSARLAALRGTVLIRDRHRCVVSRTFDIEQAEERITRDGEMDAEDDDGNGLSDPFGHLEVAHIIPHSLMRPQEGSDSRQASLPILDMFDNGISQLIDGVEIGRPFNTLTLTLDYHYVFSTFKIFFTQLPDHEPHTYKIEAFSRTPAIIPGLLPATRTLLTSPDRNIDPPSSRLLAVHRAIAHVLHLSGAGAYIGRFLSDMNEGPMQSDGAIR